MRRKLRQRARGSRACLWSACTALVLLLWAAQAGAQTPAPGRPAQGPLAAQPLTIGQRAAQSQLVVVGRVVRNEARWVGKVIVTTSHVEPTNVLKGSVAGGDLEVSFIGGTVGVINQYLTHQATLEPGELALIFLKNVSPGLPFDPGSKQFAVEEGKENLLPPGFNPDRLRHDVRLRQRLQQLQAEVKQGG